MADIEGTLTAVVWPVYAGAVDTLGVEPLYSADYQRGQIVWTVTPDGAIVGRAEILVPAGEFTHIVYTHHPASPRYASAQKLSPSLILYQPGRIDLAQITADDVQPFAPDRQLHD